MARFASRWWLAVALVPSLLLFGCGDDDDDGDSPTEPAGGAELSAGAEFFQQLSGSMNQAAALLFTGGGEVAGERGKVVVTASALDFQDYSPDGETTIDGELAINLLVQPVTVTGQLELTGKDAGVADANVTIDLTTQPPTYGGTIVLNDVEYDVAAIAAEAQEDG